MGRKGLLIITIILSIAGIACGQGTHPPLVFYAHAESLPPDAKPDRAEITFYPDGLIRTYRVTDGYGGVIVDVQVARRAKVISTVYARRDNNQYYSIAGCTINGDQATIRLQGPKGEQDELRIRRVASTPPRKTYEFDYQGSPVVMFTFAPEETELAFPRQKTAYKYGSSHEMKFATIQSSGGDEVYSSSLRADGTVAIVKKSTEGMPLWTFSAKGRVFQANPLLAIFNYELVDDGIVGVPIYPYVGGGPKR